MSIFYGVIFFTIGAMVGSFAQLAIIRWPREEDVFLKSSYCDSCKKKIPFYLNVPILGWVLLRGKSFCCKEKIPFKYLLLEFLGAFLFLGVYLLFGLSFKSLGICLFLFGAVPSFFIDLKHYLLPDIFTKSGIVIGLVLSAFSPEHSFKASLLGVLIGGGLFWFIFWAYKVIRKQEGMGFGDVKLMAWIGSFFGPLAIPFVMVAASLAGTVIGVFFILFKNKNMQMALPFGPFLIIATLLYVAFQDWIHDFLYPFFIPII